MALFWETVEPSKEVGPAWQKSTAQGYNSRPLVLFLYSLPSGLLPSEKAPQYSVIPSILTRLPQHGRPNPYEIIS